MANEKKNVPLSVIMEEAKKGYIEGIQKVNEKFNLPAFLAEPILSGILADIRQQKNIELANDYASLQNAEQDHKKEGEE